MADMSDRISYSCISYGTTVLAEAYEVLGPYAVIARKILARISLQDSKRTFEIKEYAPVLNIEVTYPHRLSPG